MEEGLTCPEKWKMALVCTDGSEASRGAVLAGLELARRCGSRVRVFMALEIPLEFESQAPELMPLVESQARQILGDVEAESQRLGTRVETRTGWRVPAYAAILQEAREAEAGLIIVGRHGRTGLARLLLGSVAARVIGHSPVSVLVVPPDATLGFKTVLVASDGSPYSAAAWDEAVALAQAAGSRLVAVSVAREEGEIIEAEDLVKTMEAAANQAGLAVTGIVPQGEAPDAAIIQAAVKHNADLIVLGSHGRTGLTRLLMGSTAERVIGQAQCPVLVVKRSGQGAV
jgi:nucleotide-binding universal stress UspA family protein